MELKNFISQALTNIVQGVEEANKTTKRFKLASATHSQYGQGQEVDFDVSVTASQDTEGDLNGKIGVAIVNISSDVKLTESNQNTHRIKFKVFITEE